MVAVVFCGDGKKKKEFSLHKTWALYYIILCQMSRPLSGCAKQQTSSYNKKKKNPTNTVIAVQRLSHNNYYVLAVKDLYVKKKGFIEKRPRENTAPLAKANGKSRILRFDDFFVLVVFRSANKFTEDNILEVFFFFQFHLMYVVQFEHFIKKLLFVLVEKNSTS